MHGGDPNSKGLKLWSISSEVEDMTHNLADVKSRLNVVFANAEASRHQNITTEYMAQVENDEQ